jgi:hypothetical protein
LGRSPSSSASQRTRLELAERQSELIGQLLAESVVTGELLVLRHY